MNNLRILGTIRSLQGEQNDTNEIRIFLDKVCYFPKIIINISFVLHTMIIIFCFIKLSIENIHRQRHWLFISKSSISSGIVKNVYFMLIVG